MEGISTQATFVWAGLAALALLAGCAGPGAGGPIADLRDVPQNLQAVLDAESLDTPLWTPAEQQALTRAYRQTVLAAWAAGYVSQPRATVEALFEKYAAQTGLGENLLPRDPGWAKRLQVEADLADWPNVRQRGIAVRGTSLRQMPTAEPWFRTPEQAEGYPFDQLQESAVWVGTPLWIAHQTRDGAWFWVQTAHSSGWAPAQDVATVDETLIAAWRDRPWAAVVRDGVSLRSRGASVRMSGGAFLATAGVGAVLPLAGPSAEGLEVLVATRHSDGSADATSVHLAPGDAAAMPVPAAPRRLAALANEMIGQPYDWGGMYGQRDCSAMTRDLFAPLGLYLPRNSSEQALAGRVIPLSELGMADKERRILREGKPLRTLLAAPGHIMLYVGSRDGRALILHTTWAVKARNADGSEGRHLIGQCCITTLRPGAELPNYISPEGDLRYGIDAMILLGESTREAP